MALKTDGANPIYKATIMPRYGYFYLIIVFLFLVLQLQVWESTVFHLTFYGGFKTPLFNHLTNHIFTKILNNSHHSLQRPRAGHGNAAARWRPNANDAKADVGTSGRVHGRQSGGRAHFWTRQCYFRWVLDECDVLWLCCVCYFVYLLLECRAFVRDSFISIAHNFFF